jgi:dimethylamine corrinoid protein
MVPIQIDMSDLIAAILEGDCLQALAQTEQLRRAGARPEDVVVHAIEAAMLTLDGKCTLEHFNLLEIMLAGRAVMEIMKVLYPAGTEQPGGKGTVVIATLEGDVHDLGKNILKIVLSGRGYRVVDGGKDCPLTTLVGMAEKERPLAVGISGLITPVIPLVKQVKNLLQQRRLEVIAGGAALKQASAGALNVDFVAESAFDVTHYLDEIAAKKA